MVGANVEVRRLGREDGPAAVAVVNAAAAWYAEFLPAAEIRESEMTLSEWEEEAQRMAWFGATIGDTLVGVMGLEYAGDAALFRHAYVLPDHQRAGVASALHRHLQEAVRGVDKIIVGTYAANYKARRALERAGYVASADPHAVLRTYYDIPADRLRSSVTYEKHLGRDDHTT